MWRHSVDERGIATVWTAGALAALLVLASLLYGFGAAVHARHRASSAADLAALAAAGYRLQGTESACQRAQWVTSQMRVQLNSCRFAQWDALIEVELALPGALSHFGTVHSHARAGPIEPVPASPVGSPEAPAAVPPVDASEPLSESAELPGPSPALPPQR